MSNSFYPYPKVTQPDLNWTDRRDVHIGMSLEDAQELAIVLLAATLQSAVKLSPGIEVLRDQLNRVAQLGASGPAPSMSEMRQVRRERRDWLADELANEERLLLRVAEISADLHPTPDHPAVIAAQSTPSSPFTADVRDWTSND